MNASDWATHGIVMGVLLGIGGVISAINLLFKDRGKWISLTGMFSFFAWIFIAAYAVASTLTFGLLRPFVGVVPSYLLALPVLAAAWGVRHALELRKDRRRDARAQVDLSSRFELISWSPETPGPGRLRLRAEIRALRDLLVRFNGLGIDADRSFSILSEPEKPVAVKAGETARLELEIKVSPDRPMVDYILEFCTWTDGKPEGTSQGVISYEKADADAYDGRLHRPLPPARPNPGH